MRSTRRRKLTGEIRSVKVGRNRRILPAWVDEYVRRVTSDVDAEGWAA